MTLLTRRSRRLIRGDSGGGGTPDPYADYIIYDSFHRSNSDQLFNGEKGGDWQYIDGVGSTIPNFGIFDNKAYALRDTNIPLAYLDAGVDSYELELGVNAFSGIAFKIQDANNLWICAYDGGPNFDLISYIGGVSRDLYRFSDVAGHGVVNVRVEKSKITVTSNGVEKGIITDSYLEDETQVGFLGSLSNGDTFNYFWAKPVTFTDPYAEYLVYDSVTRPDNSDTAGFATEKGGGYAVLTGTTWGITSHQIYNPPSGNGSILKLGDTVDGIFENTMLYTASVQPGINFRMVDASNYLLAQLNGGNLYLWKCISGAFTQLASSSVPGLLNPSNAIVSARFQGTSVKLSVSGVQLIDYTLTGNAASLAGTGCGLRSSGNDNRFGLYTLKAL